MVVFLKIIRHEYMQLMYVFICQTDHQVLRRRRSHGILENINCTAISLMILYYQVVCASDVASMLKVVYLICRLYNHAWIFRSMLLRKKRVKLIQVTADFLCLMA